MLVQPKVTPSIIFDFPNRTRQLVGLNSLYVIDQTRGRVFPPISKHREVGWKNEAQPRFFNQLRGVWK